MTSWRAHEERLRAELFMVLFDIDLPFEVVEVLELTKSHLVKYRIGFEPRNHLVHVLDPYDPELQALTAELLPKLGCQQLDASSTQPAKWITLRMQLKQSTDAAAANANAVFERLEQRLATLEALCGVADELSEDEDEDEQPRAVIVLDRALSSLGGLLRAADMLVIDVPTDDLSSATKSWLLPGRVLVVTDEEEFANDAAAYSCGIVSIRLISRRDPEHLAEMLSEAFETLSLASERHGFLLLLRDDGEHLYKTARPLVS